MGGKSVFNDAWLELPNFQPWLQAIKDDKRVFFCKVCRKQGALGKMGKKSVESHASSQCHRKALASVARSSSLFASSKSTDSEPRNGPSTSAATCTPTASTSSTTSSATLSVKDLAAASAEAARASALWTMKTIYDHQSFTSNETLGPIMKKMFPTSDAVQQFSCGKDKTGYTVKYGLAPYFKGILVKDLKSQPMTLLFDESLNKVTQRKQLDLHVRLWDCNYVKTRFFGSAFLGHSTADDLLSHFKVISMAYCIFAVI